MAECASEYSKVIVFFNIEVINFLEVLKGGLEII